MGKLMRGLLVASLLFGLSYPLIWDIGCPQA